MTSVNDEKLLIRFESLLKQALNEIDERVKAEQEHPLVFVEVMPLQEPCDEIVSGMVRFKQDFFDAVTGRVPPVWRMPCRR